MSENLVLAYVSHFDDSGDALWVRIRGGGGYQRFTVIDISDYCEGDVIVIDQEAQAIELAADEVWDELSWLGVVRIKTDTDTIISEGSLLRLVPTREEPEYEVGNTVKVRDDFGVVDVLSKKPVDSFDTLREIFGEEDFAAQFRKAPSASGPTYDDFAGYDELKVRVRDFITDSLHHRKALTTLGARPGKGALFTGDPGTGKTFLARIVANQEGATFYPVRGPEVVSKYYGQTEKVLRDIFADARKQEKAIIFFDELDSIASSRDSLANDFSRSVVAQLLTLLDGFESDNVFIVAATNRPDAIDPALKRPGRLDKVIEFPLPDDKDREAILLSFALQNTEDVRLPYRRLVGQTHGWTPAELESIWQAAARCAVREGRMTVKPEDYMRGFEQARFERSEVSRSSRSRRPEGDQQA
jgi:transitional endoplasmic reticulum ATPase